MSVRSACNILWLWFDNDKCLQCSNTVPALQISSKQARNGLEVLPEITQVSCLHLLECTCTKVPLIVTNVLLGCWSPSSRTWDRIIQILNIWVSINWLKKGEDSAYLIVLSIGENIDRWRAAWFDIIEIHLSHKYEHLPNESIISWNSKYWQALQTTVRGPVKISERYQMLLLCPWRTCGTHAGDAIHSMSFEDVELASYMMPVSTHQEWCARDEKKNAKLPV